MKILIIPIFLICPLVNFAAGGCADFDCMNEQFAQLEQKVGILENKNEQLEITVDNLEAENIELRAENDELTAKLGNLENDVAELEKIVRPGKIPANCDEYFDRGTNVDGVYQIKPNVDIEPFYVTCDFRK